jgi:hypothetical protein
MFSFLLYFYLTHKASKLPYKVIQLSLRQKEKLKENCAKKCFAVEAKIEQESFSILFTTLQGFIFVYLK